MYAFMYVCMYVTVHNVYDVMYAMHCLACRYVMNAFFCLVRFCDVCFVFLFFLMLFACMKEGLM